MSGEFAGSQANPFEDDVVREPREVSFSVKGLNDAALDRLLDKFAALETERSRRGRSARVARAQLVVSPDRGYGKSHLLGRLFARLEQRASTIYLRPFQDPNKAWQSILLTTIQELTRSGDGHPYPLERLAIAVLARLGADYIGEAEGYPSTHQVKEYLLSLAADSAWEHERKRSLIEWLTSPATVSALVRRLRQSGLNLGGRERAWAFVLASLARDEPHGDNWTAALKWLRAEPLEPDEAERLHLDRADNDSQGESSAHEVNELCFRRLRGLLLLATFYRPFVFCFDQTEFFANDPALIMTLGRCVEAFYADLRNHLTVITANNGSWVGDIWPHITAPHRDRIDPEIPLRGIQRDGSRELIVERLKRGGFDEPAIAAFFADRWLDGVFATLPELGVREVLMRAAQRFRALANQPAPAPVTLDALFRAELEALAKKARPLVYDQDALIWAVKDLGPGLAGVAVARTSGCRYFSLQWSGRDKRVVFAFEGGDSWKRWESIAKEATSLAERQGEGGFSACVFRTPDLPKIPRATWKALKAAWDSAQARGFRIIELTPEQVSELYAARELYSNALQGNIAYDGPQTLAWLQARFASFLQSLAAPAAAPSCEPAPAEEKPLQDCALAPDEQRLVVDLVRAQKIVDMAIVLEKLGGERRRADLLRCVELHPNLKAHPGPAKTFLQWRHAR